MSGGAVRFSSVTGADAPCSHGKSVPPVITQECGTDRLFSEFRQLPEHAAAGIPKPSGKEGSGATSGGGNSAACKKAPSSKLSELLQDYHVVHALPGRVRLRPLPGQWAFVKNKRDELVSLLSNAYSKANIRLSDINGSILICSPGLVFLEERNQKLPALGERGAQRQK